MGMRRRRRGQQMENSDLTVMGLEDHGMIGESGRDEKDKRLLDFCHLSDWRRDNEFIQTKYRPELRSHRKCFRTILGIHNETGNIWSHMLGCMVFVGLAAAFFSGDTF